MGKGKVKKTESEPNTRTMDTETGMEMARVKEKETARAKGMNMASGPASDIINNPHHNTQAKRAGSARMQVPPRSSTPW